jgi:hypothetical protein
MNHMIDSLKQFHLLILLKGQPTRDSRNPSILRAKISVPDGTRLAGRAGTLAGFTMQVENTGDTTWLSAENRVTGGYVGVGGHLLDALGKTIRIGFLTERLPRDVAPGERVEVRSSFGLPTLAGRFRLRLDLVADGIAWFSQKGSPTTEVEMDVAWSGSRDPHRFEARIEPLGSFPPSADAESFRLRLRLTNAGDTIWLAEPPETRGTVSVGVQLVDATGAVADRDYLRIPLPKDVTPGETVEIEAVVARPAGRDDRFAVDLVAEEICWFVTHGSKPLVFALA